MVALVPCSWRDFNVMIAYPRNMVFALVSNGYWGSALGSPPKLLCILGWKKYTPESESHVSTQIWA